jgi:hypothetical protein
VVIAYLMKLRGWRLAESYKWVKDKRPSTNISEGAHMLSCGVLCIGLALSFMSLAGSAILQSPHNMHCIEHAAWYCFKRVQFEPAGTPRWQHPAGTSGYQRSLTAARGPQLVMLPALFC